MKHCIIAALLIASLGACAQNTGGKNAVKTNITTSEFEKQISSVKNRILLDVRTPEEFNNGHISGAVNMNIYDDNFKQQISRLDTSQPVYVYCLSGGRSSQAADILSSMGFPAVYNMTGGISRWRGENRAVVMPAGEALKGMSKADFDQLVKASGDTLVLVDFWAKWCAPCKKIMAFLPELEKEYQGKLKIVKVNYDDNTALVKSLALDNVPYLFIYKNGKEIWKNSGFTGKEQILTALNVGK
jgi:thioredoxin